MNGAAEQLALFDVPPLSTPLFKIDPSRIVLHRTDQAGMVLYQRAMSRATWRPSPGRNLAFLAKHDDALLGLIFLASPVLNFGVRDRALGLPDDYKERGQALRHYADLSVCVGAQPIAWHWNLGKLLAMIATTLGDVWLAQYGDELYGVTTTSLYGRGSQYNRIYRYLGKSQGYGHEHISDEEYDEMIAALRRKGVVLVSSRKSNVRMRRIQQYRQSSGDGTVGVFHGNRRGVFFHEAVPPETRPAVIQRWYERWGRPRYDRTRLQTAPYSSGVELTPTDSPTILIS